MSINSITSAAATYANGGLSQLSEETKQKLIALGLDPTQFKTEAQAQQKIAEVQAIKQQNNSQSSTAQKNGNSTQAELISEAKTLASQAGVSVSKTDTLDEILENISDAISKMDAKNPNTKYLQERLAAIQNESLQAESSISSLDNMMSMAATSNKLALGLS